jgi:hypothetical protein
MRWFIVAALALAAGSRLGAQTIPDLSTAAPIAGAWIYASASDGSEATFANAGAVQLSIHCIRASRRVRIAKAAGSAAPVLAIWTSGLTRNLGASFDTASRRLTVELAP